jgi:hypothetical protein
MADANSRGARAPWHLWAVGGLGVLWNAYGCYDFSMTQIGGEDYLRAYGMTDAQIDYFNAMPVWMTGAWAVGVWGAMAGSVLLLLRRKWAFPVFVASLAAFVLSLVYTYLLTNGAEIAGDQGLILNGVILTACLFFAWYAWAMSRKGVLR